MVWGYDYYGDSNIVNTHIKNIRKGAEQGKIACAKKYFKAISGGAVKYGVVNTYEHLIDLVTGIVPLSEDYSKTDNNSSKDNDDLDDFILFNMFFNDKK